MQSNFEVTQLNHFISILGAIYMRKCEKMPSKFDINEGKIYLYTAIHLQSWQRRIKDEDAQHISMMMMLMVNSKKMWNKISHPQRLEDEGNR